MFSLLIALAAAIGQNAPAGSPTTAVQARLLKDVPGIAVTYHDLADKDVQDIIKALKKKKALTPAQQTLLAASTSWGVSPSVIKATKGTACTVTKAQIEFTPKADLPRFNEAVVPAEDKGQWRTYLAATEAQAAAKLWFAYDRLPTFERAVVGKPCDQAMTDGMAAIAKLKADAAAFQPPVAAVPPVVPASARPNARVAPSSGQPMPPVAPSASPSGY